MHRLVRLFVLVEMVLGSDDWRKAFVQALNATHGHIKLSLENFGKSFTDDPESYAQVPSLPHALSIVNNFIRAGIETELTECQSSELGDLHHFASLGLNWSGRIYDALTVAQSQLRLRYRMHGTEQ